MTAADTADVTDTIGWGDVDVDPVRTRRRRHALRFVWPIVVAVVAGVVLTPVVTSHLADDAARWVAQQWDVAYALDDAREQALARTSELLGVADMPAYVQFIRDIDTTDLTRLRSLESGVRDHHAWESDVGHAEDAVRRALAAEITDLQVEIRQVPYEVTDPENPFAPAPLSPATTRLIATADRLVAKALSAHHVKQPRREHVTFPQTQAFVTRMSRLTDTPLPVRLVIPEGEGYVVWNLSTGTRRVVALPSAEFDGIEAVVDKQTLLVQGDGYTRLIYLDGRPSHTFADRDSYWPAGHSLLWQFSDALTKVTESGRPVGPRYSLPAGYGYEQPFSADALTVTKFVPVAEQHPDVNVQAQFVWRPASNRFWSAQDACSQLAGAIGTAVYQKCNADAVVVLDTRTGHRRLVRLPAHGSASLPGALSPDGRFLAATVSAAEDDQQIPLRIDIVDLVTGAVTASVPDPGHGAPIGWSSDSSTLVLFDFNDTGDSMRANVSYWRQGMTTVGSIRIPDGGTSNQVTVL